MIHLWIIFMINQSPNPKDVQFTMLKIKEKRKMNSVFVWKYNLND